MTWYDISLALGLLCAAVPAASAWALGRRGAPWPFVVSLALAAAGSLVLAVSDFLDPCFARAGAMRLSQFVFFVLHAGFSGMVAASAILGVTGLRRVGTDRQRLVGLRRYGILVVALWTAAAIAVMGWEYLHGGVYLMADAAPGGHHEEARVALARAFVAGYVPTHLVVAFAGLLGLFAAERRAGLRRVLRSAVLSWRHPRLWLALWYGLLGAAACVLLLLVHSEKSWMRWPGDAADSAMWTLMLGSMACLCGYGALSMRAPRESDEDARFPVIGQR